MTTIRPNARGVNAYQRGHRAHASGVPRDGNPGFYLTGPASQAFSGWWDTGWGDAEQGEPDRFADA